MPVGHQLLQLLAPDTPLQLLLCLHQLHDDAAECRERLVDVDGFLEVPALCLRATEGTALDALTACRGVGGQVQRVSVRGRAPPFRGGCVGEGGAGSLVVLTIEEITAELRKGVLKG